jgi:hypothetical protein
LCGKRSPSFPKPKARKVAHNSRVRSSRLRCERLARHLVQSASPSISFGSRRNNRRLEGTHITLMSADKPVAPSGGQSEACAESRFLGTTEPVAECTGCGKVRIVCVTISPAPCSTVLIDRAHRGCRKAGTSFKSELIALMPGPSNSAECSPSGQPETKRHAAANNDLSSLANSSASTYQPSTMPCGIGVELLGTARAVEFDLPMALLTLWKGNH